MVDRSNLYQCGIPLLFRVHVVMDGPETTENVLPGGRAPKSLLQQEITKFDYCCEYPMIKTVFSSLSKSI